MRQAIEVFKGNNQDGQCFMVVRSAGDECHAEWSYALNFADNHLEAARDFADHKGWMAHSNIHGGQLDNGNYVFVVVPL